MTKDTQPYPRSLPKPIKPSKLWLFGWHAVMAAWANPARICYRLVVSENGIQEFTQRTADLALDAARPAPEIADRAKLDKLLGRDTVHQGIALEVAPLEDVTLDDLLRMVQVRPKIVMVMLDHVTDPHNIGAIMRSAAAFGAGAIIMQDRHAPPPTGTLAKAASGALELVPLCYVTNLSRTLAELAKVGVQGLAFDEGGTSLAKLELPAKTCLVMGAEGEGLRPSVREACAQTVALPTAQEFTTLNVSNATAISLYEWYRQH